MTRNHHDDKDIVLDLPNTDLAFFAYGIFKPGQLAYSRITKYVEDYKKAQINYKMLLRDGVPIINHQDNGHNQTNGYLIKFKKDESRKAYEIICKTQHKKLYKWEEIEIDGINANVLMGINPKLGSSSIGIEDYDGRKDPYFKEALDVVENELNDETKKWHDVNDFFKLQMSYMLLWASIERYASLKYDNNSSKITQFSKDKLFKESLKKYVHEKRTVYSADDLNNRTLDPENSYESGRYYYTIRCNAVHRGKSLHSDEYMLRQSLNELLNIFKHVLKNTFDES